MGLRLEEVDGGFRIVGSGVGISEEWSMEEVAKCLCLKIGIEYIGNMVLIQERTSDILVKREEKVYRQTYFSYQDRHYTLEFHEFAGKLEDVEPIENYRYRVSYFNYEAGVEAKSVYYSNYFKEDELEQAKQRQEELKEKIAFLDEI